MKQRWTKPDVTLSDIPSPGYVLLVVVLAIALTAPSGLAQDNSETQAFVPVRSTYGVSIGTPAFLNFNTDQFFSENIGVRFAGGYLPGGDGSYVAGLQVGPIMKLVEKPGSCTSVGVAIGYMAMDNPPGYGFMDWWDYEFIYGAVTFGYRYRSFFLETGLSVGDGDDSNLMLLFQGGINFKTVRRAP